MIEIAGKVRGGRGLATAQIAEVKAELEVITGATIVPGTLNVILDRPLRLNETEAHFFDQNSRMLWSATLNDVDVWVYRWKHTALHVVEVLSCIHLRERFGLNDGDRIVLTMRPEQIGRIGAMGWTIWLLVWLGRRDLCYTNDRYYFALCRFCEIFGATQRTRTKFKLVSWASAKIGLGNMQRKAPGPQPRTEDFANVSQVVGAKPTGLTRAAALDVEKIDPLAC